MAKSKFIKHSLKKITKSKPFMALMSTIIHAYARLVWKTGRWKICGLETMIKIWKKDQSIILIGWHNRVPMMPMLMEHAQGPMKALVSLHNDGRMIAGFLEKFNIGIISGSSNNNAKGAARQYHAYPAGKHFRHHYPRRPPRPANENEHEPGLFCRQDRKTGFCHDLQPKGRQNHQQSLGQNAGSGSVF